MREGGESYRKERGEGWTVGSGRWEVDSDQWLEDSGRCSGYCADRPAYFLTQATDHYVHRRFSDGEF
jgi:hypothetical protein